jgi:hypothetical protein
MHLVRPLFFAAAVCACGALLVLDRALESTPQVWPAPPAGNSYADTARDLFRKTARNPMEQQQVKSITLSAADLTAVGNFVLSRKRWDGHVTILIDDRQLTLRSSIKLPTKLAALYVNLTLFADDGDPQAQVTRMKIGRLDLPGPAARLVLIVLQKLTPIGRFTEMAAPLVKEIRIQDENVRLSLNWSPDALNKAQDMATDFAMKERMLAYHNRLGELVHELGIRRFVPLGSLTQPLFLLAQTRSQNAENPPVDENRALILVLGAYANGRDLSSELAAAGDPAVLEPRRILLNRRIDTAQHFTASAALATSGHRTLADIVGLAKEINDIRHGSGFSFTDLAADRAGTLFGKAAVKSVDDARKVQAVMGASTDESVFMPSLKGLPENLGAADFASQFRDIESPEFLEIKRQIEERILACMLYQ